MQEVQQARGGKKCDIFEYILYGQL